jgi:hypothetical protein
LHDVAGLDRSNSTNRVVPGDNAVDNLRSLANSPTLADFVGVDSKIIFNNYLKLK